MKRKLSLLKLFVACSAIAGFNNQSSATGPGYDFQPPGDDSSYQPVGQPQEPLFLVYMDVEYAWNVTPPGGYTITSAPDFSMPPSIYYTHTIDLGEGRSIGIFQANFYNPQLNSWWTAGSSYINDGLTYYQSSDPTGGLINPSSAPFHPDTGGGGEEEHEGGYNEGYEQGFNDGSEEGFDAGVEEVLSDPAAYGLVSTRNIPSVKVAARRGTKLSISLTGNWNRFAASGVPRGWRFDKRKGILSGTMGRNGTLTIRSSRGSASAAPIRIQLQSTAR